MLVVVCESVFGLLGSCCDCLYFCVGCSVHFKRTVNAISKVIFCQMSRYNQHKQQWQHFNILHFDSVDYILGGIILRMGISRRAYQDIC